MRLSVEGEDEEEEEEDDGGPEKVEILGRGQRSAILSSRTRVGYQRNTSCCRPL